VVDLPLPAAGLFELGMPLTLTFSEPIRPETLTVRVWPSRPEDKDIEDEFRVGVMPVVTDCSTSSACSNAQLTVLPDRQTAELVLTDSQFGEAKFPWVLEVLPGIQDDDGRETRAPYWFDFQFSPAIPSVDGTDGGEPVLVDWNDGLYLLHAQIEDPFKVPLNMALDIIAKPDGVFMMGGVKLTAMDSAPKNTTNIDELMVDITDQGFGVFAQGNVTLDGEQRFLATEPFDVNIAISSIKIQLSGMRLTGAVVPHPATGEDRVEGTLTFSGLTLDFGTGEPVSYDGDNTDFFMEKIVDADVPEGAGQLCGSPCGAVTSQCEPPDSFSIEEYCSDNATGGVATGPEPDESDG